METLQRALEELTVTAEGSSRDWTVDDILESPRPYKRAKRSAEDIKKELEEEFLSPSPWFNDEWLNRLQHRWQPPTDYADLLDITPTQTRTIIRFTREGLEGRVTGYKELTVPASSATAKNSTSILRKPANRAEFVRGAAGFFPFAPGGLDGVEAVAAAEDNALQHELTERASGKLGLDRVIQVGAQGALLEVPPGFSRGLSFARIDQDQVERATADEVQAALAEDPEPMDANAPGQILAGVTADVQREDSMQSEEYAEEDEIDALLPVEFPALAPRSQLAFSSLQKGGKEWAHMVDINREISNFKELVPDMAREWPFELDTFQKEAVYHLENGDSVFVAAHTSAGKTVVAEYAIALAAKHMTKAIYTSPIKALSNQKFRDFRNTFDDVGILTGDVQIRPEASCLIMTTEILRSMLYRGADLIRDVEFVIFDEVHYVNDLERGVVWEEVIIMLPEHVTLILLSATVPNTYEFASWVGRTKKKDIYVISTPKRPVPLEYYLWAKKSMHKIVNEDKQFLDKGWKEANDILTGADKVKAPVPDQAGPPRGSINQRGSNRGQDRGRARGNQRGGPQRGGPQRGGGQRGPPAGRGQPSHRGHGNIARTGRGGGRTTAAQDRTIWVHLVQYLRKENLLPACIFVFSKKRCEENADALSSLDFCSAVEKSAVHMIIERSVARLKPEDRGLPQIRRLRELLGRGIAVHHGGMLPIVKEMVEILFARGLVKVLFATETFAMGLNLPTRTVAFSGYRKHDGRSFRDLLPGEVTQMSGRAGRRGIDSVGTVIFVLPGADDAPPSTRLRQMILGDATKLKSQFRLTYTMILNLLRVEALKIEEMIKRSFSENATQALLPEHEKQVKLSEADLAKIKREPCDICDIDLAQCHEASMMFEKLNAEMHLTALGSPVSKRMFTAKRLVIFRRDGVRSVGVLTRDGANATMTKAAVPTVPILEFTSKKSRSTSDVLPCLGEFAKFFDQLPTTQQEMKFRVTLVPVSDLECLTRTIIGGDQPVLKALHDRKLQSALLEVELFPIFQSWTYKDWDELDWTRVKNLEFNNVREKRAEASKLAQETQCFRCPKFVQHFAMQHDEWLIKENINQLRQLMSDQNLQLLPDYEQRIQVLKELGFIDENSRVELKGKVACEVHSADELVLTELILENALADYEPEEIVALLSAFVFEEKTDSEPTLTPRLEKGKNKIIEISNKVNRVQETYQVILSSDDSNDFVSKPRFGMVEVVYEWARGMSFNRITDLTDVMEGTIVRVITRLDETCREVKNAARLVGDPTLFTKMQTCQEMIKRDVCAVASLYM
ncbi:antiviral helicase [Eremomyces bilateralis CBS 781.70]|uniref:Antiviral helicase n=1 Tax=Eremomyces bilateralis CBS 781.70 TaxID=1392243 RepID=A0A6G1G4Z5_9PEZI|nr:antiviral helicase [Eremomyces bilateralis CBS 781.70]KAF1813072.1 antiviral helicase [Eremomyces bilateralis CBS 781.70]